MNHVEVPFFGHFEFVAEYWHPQDTGLKTRTANVTFPLAGRWKLMVEILVEGEFTELGDPKFKTLCEHLIDVLEDPNIQ